MNGQGHFQQTDRTWNGIEWYAPALFQATIALTSLLHKREDGISRTPLAIYRALRKFNQEVRRIATRPRLPRPRSIGSFHQAGCFLTSQAILLKILGVRLRGHEPTPLRLLKEFRRRNQITILGFDETICVDQLVHLTAGKVQLLGHEDFGQGGVSPTRSRLLRSLGKGRAAIVNVRTHEFRSASDWTHYVVLTARCGRNFTMLDPDEKRAMLLMPTYRKVFQVWLYTKGGGR